MIDVIPGKQQPNSLLSVECWQPIATTYRDNDERRNRFL